MPSTTSTRPSHILPVLLLGIGAFAVVLLVSLSRGPAPQVLAQEACAQPSNAGCRIELDYVAVAVLADPAATHNWLLNVTVPDEIVVSLGNLAGDYQLWVYGPDNSLLGLSNNPGTSNETVRAANIGPGTYWIVVDSPSGQASQSPYALFAIAQPSAEAAPPPAGPAFGTYEGPRPVRGFLPY